MRLDKASGRSGSLWLVIYIKRCGIRNSRGSRAGLLDRTDMDTTVHARGDVCIGGCIRERPERILQASKTSVLA